MWAEYAKPGVALSIQLKARGCSRYPDDFSDDVYTIDMDLVYDLCLAKISSVKYGCR